MITVKMLLPLLRDAKKLRIVWNGFTKEIDYDVCMGMMERMLIDTANKRKTEGEK